MRLSEVGEENLQDLPLRGGDPLVIHQIEISEIRKPRLERLIVHEPSGRLAFREFRDRLDVDVPDIEEKPADGE